MISVIAKLPIKADMVDEAVEVVKGLVSKVAEEEGCLLYTLNIDKNNPNVLVFMERYKDGEALKFHSSTPYFQEFFGKVAGYLDGEPEITTFKEIASI